jgi:hypothetical protein
VRCAGAVIRRIAASTRGQAGSGRRAVMLAGGLGLAIAAPPPVLPELAWAAESGRTTSGESGAVTNWAGDVATEAVSARGREKAEASRVALDVRGGAVLVQWSLSYDAYANDHGGAGNRFPVARVQPMAALERNGTEIARWTLGENQARGPKDASVQARLTGTASGLFIDRAPGSGRKTYVLKVWNDRGARLGEVTVGTRTMVCEER